MLDSCVTFPLEAQGGGYNAKLVTPPTGSTQRTVEALLELLEKKIVQQGQENFPTGPSRADVPNGNIILPSGCEGVCFRPCEINVRVNASDHRLSENPTIVEVFAQQTEAIRLGHL